MVLSKLEKARKTFLKKRKLKIIELIAKGYSSEVFLVTNINGKKFALKAEKKISPRKNLVQKEVDNLLLANSKKIGPKLIASDENAGVILMQFISGLTFNNWLFEKQHSKKQMEKFLQELFLQANTLDKIGLDHGQLAGRGKNILVKNGLPVIIDFEKASQTRRCTNVNQLKSFLILNPHSAIARRVNQILKNS